MSSRLEVQVITAVSTASDLGGYFFVGYEGHWSEKIAYDASADDMASALSGIPAVGEVAVSKNTRIRKNCPGLPVSIRYGVYSDFLSLNACSGVSEKCYLL